jgi:hypothetical protein
VDIVHVCPSLCFIWETALILLVSTEGSVDVIVIHNGPVLYSTSHDDQIEIHHISQNVSSKEELIHYVIR